MKKTMTLIYAGFLSLILSGCITLSLFPQMEPFKETILEGSGDAKILILDISGVISEESGGGMVEEPSIVPRIKEELVMAEGDSASDECRNV